jgi:hypothetical protein
VCGGVNGEPGSGRINARQAGSGGEGQRLGGRASVRRVRAGGASNAACLSAPLEFTEGKSNAHGLTKMICVAG